MLYVLCLLCMSRTLTKRVPKIDRVVDARKLCRLYTYKVQSWHSPKSDVNRFSDSRVTASIEVNQALHVTWIGNQYFLAIFSFTDYCFATFVHIAVTEHKSIITCASSMLYASNMKMVCLNSLAGSHDSSHRDCIPTWTNCWCLDVSTTLRERCFHDFQGKNGNNNG